MKNDIPLKQNEQRQLERLAAQRELYSSAKGIYIFQTILTLVVPVISTAFAIFFIALYNTPLN
jgi:hypothetical protein